MIAASSSNVAPSDVPEPAVVSRQSTVVARRARERLGDRVRVARDARLAIVHVVAGMRHEVVEPERRAPPELADERLDRRARSTGSGLARLIR